MKHIINWIKNLFKPTHIVAPSDSQPIVVETPAPAPTTIIKPLLLRNCKAFSNWK